MSLIKEFDDRRRNIPKPVLIDRHINPLDPLNGQEGIWKHKELLEIMDKVLGEASIGKDEAKRMDDLGYRYRLVDHVWSLRGIIGKVNAGIWRNMIIAALNSSVKHLDTAQGNGSWQLCEFDRETRKTIEGHERIFLVCKYVDVNGDTDMTYNNGIPSNQQGQPRQQGLTPELIEAIKGNQSSEVVNKLLERLVALEEAKARVEAGSAGVDVSDLLDVQSEDEAPAPRASKLAAKKRAQAKKEE